MDIQPSPLARKPLEERFWAKVQKLPNDGCWIWTAHTNEHGYGRLSIKRGVVERAHRISWRLHFGSIPDGLCVLHKCDNPPCIRPDHLFLGTKTDNSVDRQTKHRAPHGEG